MARDDPLPLASLAAELMERAAKDPRLAGDAGLRGLLADLTGVLPILRMDEPRIRAGSIAVALDAQAKANDPARE